MNFSSRTLTRLSGETQLEPCRVAADSHHALPAEGGHLGGRVRPVLGDACLVGKGRWPAAAVRWDSNPAPGCFAVRGHGGE
jgi:hypothetical protein